MNNINIDIHGMTTIEAKKRLQQIITSAKPNIELTVIHGYHDGQALQRMVRKSLKHKLIKQKILTMNPGETILIIN